MNKKVFLAILLAAVRETFKKTQGKLVFGTNCYFTVFDWGLHCLNFLESLRQVRKFVKFIRV